VKRLGDVAKQLSPDDVRALFPDAWWWEDPFHLQNDEVPVLFVDNSVAIDGTLTAGEGPWNLIIQGDLHATVDLDFSTGSYKTSLLVVLGSVRARNFRYMNSAACMIAQDLIAADYVFGRFGDEGARLDVGGTLRARALLLDHVTPASAEAFDAIVCTVEGWDLPIDIDYSADNRDRFAPNVLDKNGRLDMRSAWAVARAGDPVLLPDAEAQLRRR
jgi:hypothetical protein